MSGNGGSLDTRRVAPIAEIPSNPMAICTSRPRGFFLGGDRGQTVGFVGSATGIGYEGEPRRRLLEGVPTHTP